MFENELYTFLLDVATPLALEAIISPVVFPMVPTASTIIDARLTGKLTILPKIFIKKYLFDSFLYMRAIFESLQTSAF
jgi:hypothetical protein